MRCDDTIKSNDKLEALCANPEYYKTVSNWVPHSEHLIAVVRVYD